MCNEPLPSSCFNTALPPKKAEKATLELDICLAAKPSAFHWPTAWNMAGPSKTEQGPICSWTGLSLAGSARHDACRLLSRRFDTWAPNLGPYGYLVSMYGFQIRTHTKVNGGFDLSFSGRSATLKQAGMVEAALNTPGSNSNFWGRNRTMTLSQAATSCASRYGETHHFKDAVFIL